MPFELSDPKINRNGRPLGSMNKNTRISIEIKSNIANIVNTNTKQIELDLLSLPPELRVKYYIELCKFVLPQLNKINYDTEAEYLEKNLEQINVTIVK
jgi:hypothetical protein